jgi:hypothetical protein
MNVIFIVMKAFAGVEGSLRHVSGALGQACDDRHQLQRDHDSEIERLQTELAQLTLERDQALHWDEAARQEIQRLTTANRNGEGMLIHVLHQRNEA